MTRHLCSCFLRLLRLDSHRNNKGTHTLNCSCVVLWTHAVMMKRILVLFEIECFRHIAGFHFFLNDESQFIVILPIVPSQCMDITLPRQRTPRHRVLSIWTAHCSIHGSRITESNCLGTPPPFRTPSSRGAVPTQPHTHRHPQPSTVSIPK